MILKSYSGQKPRGSPGVVGPTGRRWVGGGDPSLRADPEPGHYDPRLEARVRVAPLRHLVVAQMARRPDDLGSVLCQNKSD